jgi:hypothetical protein
MSSMAGAGAGMVAASRKTVVELPAEVSGRSAGDFVPALESPCT